MAASANTSYGTTPYDAKAYDDKADAPTALRRGLEQAQAERKDVLVIFGANWCPDCRELDLALHRSQRGVIESRFVIVKVDVGNFDHNLDLAARYGNPIKSGIPAAVVLTSHDKVIYATKAGELANARQMSDQSIFDFLSAAVGGLPSGI